MNNKLCFFLSILIALSINACSDNKATYINESNKLENTAKSYNLPSLLGLNEEGTVVVLDSNTGNKVEPCIQQKYGQEYIQGKDINKICQIEIKEENGEIFVLKNGKVDPTAKVTKIISVAYKGSHCVAHKSGTQYEICWPW